MNLLEKCDVFGVKPISRLHFNEDEINKSALGGICSLIIFSFVLFNVLI